VEKTAAGKEKQKAALRKRRAPGRFFHDKQRD